MKEINNKQYYTAKELAEMLGKNLKSYQKFLMHHAEEFERIKEGITYFYPEDVIEKTRAICEKKPKAPKQPKKARKFSYSTFWKVSVYEPGIRKFIVRHCSLSRIEAKKLQDHYIENGMICRATPH